VGDYEILVTFVADGKPPSPDLYLADVRAAGRSVIDSGFQVGVDDVDAMEIVVGTAGGSIAGSIQGRRTNTSGILLLIPSMIRDETAPYRAMPIAVNGNDQFEFRGLRPGNYRILAVQANGNFVKPANSSNLQAPSMELYLRPEFFTQNEASTIKVTVFKGMTTGGVQVPFLFSVKQTDK
jgi:hypothetical protein